ncbi:MAG: thioredoxin domain-containing protein [Deltaproteobacteria bacterium]|nr:MAG: thioredoxin domain-containing protein [Deltaproteobacteria bacterium]
MGNGHARKDSGVNRLIHEKSPYLLQHAENPVDWFPWGKEPFDKAKKEDKPIFLSIGYSTCHWCHVMAHESFEDEEVGRMLNEGFISIKVDREELPDVDMVYMAVCQAITLKGGWPLSIFMTPQGKPFYAGTYFPRSGRMGMVGFTDILSKIAAVWQSERGELLEASEKITLGIQPKPSSGFAVELGLETLQKGYDQLLQAFDPQWGGFGQAPKFPTPHNLTFLLRWHKRGNNAKALEMVERTLDAMRSGGIFDHIGFGFSRYSVDERWLVPHFEKMLYDQALLSIAYSEAYLATGMVRHGRVAAEILTYVLRDMTSPEGAFYTAEDADSEGKEGLFYVWTPPEVKEHLGKDLGELFCRFYDVGPHGNFEEGRSIPHLRMSLEDFAAHENMELEELEQVLEEARAKLFSARQRRVHPLKDDKVLTSWNGLMIAAMAKAYQALGDKAYVDAARKAVDFIRDKLWRPGPRLYRRYRDGEVAYPGYLDDYAFFVWGLIELYEATFVISYLEEAIGLNRVMIELFWDEAGGGFFYGGKDNEILIKRSKEIYDGAIPSSNSVAVLNLLRLASITGDEDLRKRAEQAAGVFSKRIKAYPSAYTHFLSALDFIIGPRREIVILGDRDQEMTTKMVETIHKEFFPNKTLLLRPEGEEGQRLTAIAPFVKKLDTVEERPTLYLCQEHAGQRPITGLAELNAALAQI